MDSAIVYVFDRMNEPTYFFGICVCMLALIFSYISDCALRELAKSCASQLLLLIGEITAAFQKASPILKV